MDGQETRSEARERVLGTLDLLGGGALLLALAGLCTRAMLTGGHPAIMSLIAASVSAGLFWRTMVVRRRLQETQLIEALEAHEAALVASYRRGHSWRRDLDHFLMNAVAPKPHRYAAWRESRSGRFYARWAEEFVSLQAVGRRAAR